MYSNQDSHERMVKFDENIKLSIERAQTQQRQRTKRRPAFPEDHVPDFGRQSFSNTSPTSFEYIQSPALKNPNAQLNESFAQMVNG